ncbi:hypothetical protein E2C01_101537 [Portunus trituberculatus]|uniref:Uncharacterized protein n=1 Tax=Portunus trituberculatus TaxID=210409 RepID=A0A5B7KB04_PORTR|nr:hypothetical protein [Portunus trituberculatus]
MACDRLEAMGTRVRRGSAGLFIWFSVKSFLCPVTMEEEGGKPETVLVSTIKNRCFDRHNSVEVID